MFTVYKINHDSTLSHREELNNESELHNHLDSITYNTIKVVKTSLNKAQDLFMIRNPMTDQFNTFKKSEVYAVWEKKLITALKLGMVRF